MPGALLIPLRITTKLSMAKSENSLENQHSTRKENFLKIYQHPWELPANLHQTHVFMAGAG